MELLRKGLDHFMRVPPDAAMPSLNEGVDAIVREVDASGDEIMHECLRYVLHETAGSSPALFPNSPYPRDCGPNGVLPERQRNTD